MINTQSFSSPVDNIWGKRWEAVKAQIGFLNSLTQSSNTTFVSNDLKNLLDSLDSFGGKMFAKLGEELEAEKVEDYHAYRVMGHFLHRIQVNIDVIQRVIAQRSALDVSILEVADKLIADALKPAESLFALPTLTPIAYFTSTPRVHILPYASVALVGIPYSCSLENTRDFLSIPHEVGHLVYWFGQVEGEKESSHLFYVSYLPELLGFKDQKKKFLHEKLPNALKKNDPVHNWAEELFADFYGAFVAGPVIGLSFLEMQLYNKKEQLETNDSEHPLPIMRPYLYAEILDHFFTNKSFGSSIIDAWEKELVTVYGADTAEKAVTVWNNGEIMPSLEPFKKLFDIDFTGQPIWDPTNYSSDKPEEWFINFKNKVIGLLNSGNNSNISTPVSPVDIDRQIDSWLNTATSRKQRVKKLMAAGGWSTKGPVDNPPVKD